jgi:hypothetical protein
LICIGNAITPTVIPALDFIGSGGTGFVVVVEYSRLPDRKATRSPGRGGKHEPRKGREVKALGLPNVDRLEYCRSIDVQ